MFGAAETGTSAFFVICFFVGTINAAIYATIVAKLFFFRGRLRQAGSSKFLLCKHDSTISATIDIHARTLTKNHCARGCRFAAPCGATHLERPGESEWPGRPRTRPQTPPPNPQNT